MMIIGRLCPAQQLFAAALFASSWFYIAGISDFMNDYLASITVDTVVNQTASLPSISGTSAIFFNAFISPENEENGLRIVKEQLDQIASSYITSLKDQQVTVYFNTIGSPILDTALLNQLCETRNVTCQILNHYQSAFEEVTLQSLYNFCQDQDDESLRVAYLHNKGSFHSSRGSNERWRRHLTAAAMHEHCWNPPNDTCNVCGLQFWPVWNTFFPGNMWIAKCSYVRQLRPPTGFENQMDSVVKKAIELQKEGRIVNGLYPHRKGGTEIYKGYFALERYALEHWIGSHPDLQPCDVSGSRAGDLTAWTQRIGNKSDFVWSMAPRRPLFPGPHYWFPLRDSKVHEILQDENRRMREYFLLPGHLLKWIHLYNVTPPASSWVWSWYPDSRAWRERVDKFGNVIEKILY
jgi:hypothetical protein